MMRLLSHPDSAIQVASNDHTMLVISANGDMVLLVCVHCGGLRNGIVSHLMGKSMGEYDLQKATVNEQVRCLCNGRKSL
jgi:hypothetical protein